MTQNSELKKRRNGRALQRFTNLIIRSLRCSITITTIRSLKLSCNYLVQNFFGLLTPQPLAAYINDSELANLAASQSMTFSWTLQYRCIYIWDTKYMYISHVHFNVGRCRLAIHLTLPMRDSRIQDYQNHDIGRLYHI